MTAAVAIVGAALVAAVALLAVRLRRLRTEVARHRRALVGSVERLEHIERAFQRFAPLEVVEQIAQGATAVAPASKRVTIMFADLKGFTPLSEQIPPAEMIEMLNGYFRAMNGAIVAHHGHLARLMGDGLMALFGALENNPWQTADAVKAALAMREALAAYNAELAQRGCVALEFGVGIHTGEVVAGVMGSDRFMEFTVIGDPVNVAARIEALTRTHGVDILVTEAVREALDARFVLRAMPPTVVKGKAEPIVTYAVESYGVGSAAKTTTDPTDVADKANEANRADTKVATSRRELLRGAAVAAGGLAVESCVRVPAVAQPSVPRAFVPGGLEVHGTRFVRDGRPFFMNGFNYWAAATLAREDVPGGWDQLRRDLDALQSGGINAIRVMAATEGPNTEPMRIVPTLQPAPGRFDPAGVAGLLRLARELDQRKLVAIFILNDFWIWSGGMAQYLAWAGAGPIPYPPPAPGGSWDSYQRYAARFYTTPAATESFRQVIRTLVPQLKDSPSVIWELANEPRGINNTRAFRVWIDETAALIRSLAPGQLITTGSEGQTASAFFSGTDVVRDHESPNIDFVTFHLWAENWGWVRKHRITKDMPRALDRARRYIEDHVARATKVGKPLLLEEFGFPRDDGRFDPGSPTTFRDQYFREIFALVASLASSSTPMAGIMPWAWAGETRPPRPGELWKPGDPFIGDPPHEQQGWYSVYAADSTWKLMKNWSRG